MIGDYEIIEYINPCFPDKQMYKCKIGDEIYHTDDYAKMVDSIIYHQSNKEYYEECKRVEAIAMASFMADVKIKD